MLKNGRPYSNENGFIDNALISDKTLDDLFTIAKWIKDNIRPSRTILKYHTSYGLKHILEHDTGLHLTNNEFKDALLLAGYAPVNPNELNWRYRIKLLREINYNPSPFFNWAKQFKDEDSPEGDFVRDMLHEFDFPIFADTEIIDRYLYCKGACDGAYEAFDKLWKRYTIFKENNA